MDTEIKNGSDWKRKSSDQLVEIIDTDLKVKAPADANWHDAVEYIADDEVVYVRTHVDFLDKYEPVEDTTQATLPTI